MGETSGPRFAVEAVCFDLLTALLDSWTLWEAVAAAAGYPGRGEPWRHAALRRVTASGDYRPYAAPLREGAVATGLPGTLVDRLLARLRARAELPLATAMNCPEALARQAATILGDPFAVVVSAERAGAYKPDPHPYRLALAELGLPPARVLFVAGSAHDVGGALRAGMPVVWVNRLRLPAPPDAAGAAVVPDLTRLPELLA